MGLWKIGDRREGERKMRALFAQSPLSLTQDKTEDQKGGSNEQTENAKRNQRI